jgi:hypothetical protein
MLFWTREGGSERARAQAGGHFCTSIPVDLSEALPLTLVAVTHLLIKGDRRARTYHYPEGNETDIAHNAYSYEEW